MAKLKWLVLIALLSALVALLSFKADETIKIVNKYDTSSLKSANQ